MGEFATKASRFTQVLAFIALVAGALAGCQPIETKPGNSQRILFVGNSLTYVGNLPAVVEAIGASNGKNISTEMLVAGGATLTDRLSDGSVEKLLQETRYDYVVLQERGAIWHAMQTKMMRRVHAAPIPYRAGPRMLILPLIESSERTKQRHSCWAPIRQCRRSRKELS